MSERNAPERDPAAPEAPVVLDADGEAAVDRGGDPDVDESGADAMDFDARTADEQENLPGQGSASPD